MNVERVVSHTQQKSTLIWFVLFSFCLFHLVVFLLFLLCVIYNLTGSCFFLFFLPLFPLWADI